MAEAPGHELPQPAAERAWKPPRREWFGKVGAPFFHPHMIRHTAATELESSFDPDIARTVLGHRDVRATQVYEQRGFARAKEHAVSPYRLRAYPTTGIVV